MVKGDLGQGPRPAQDGLDETGPGRESRRVAGDPSSADARGELLADLRGGVLWLTLNRPDRRNSISPELREALLRQLERAGGDHDVRALVLTGAGDAFCSGVDISRFRAAGAPPGEGA